MHFEKQLNLALAVLSEADETEKPATVATIEPAEPASAEPAEPAEPEEPTPPEITAEPAPPEAEWSKLPKDLATLRRIKKPIEHGWTESEVVLALLPFIINLAKKYITERFPMDDAIQEGAIGVLNALRTDKGMAPFSTHAWPHIRTAIRRASAQSGLIRRPERHAAFHDVGIVPLDKPRGEGEYSLADTIRAREPELAEVASSLETFQQLFDEADRSGAPITDQQKRVIMMVFGLDGKGERTGEQIAAELGMSRQRVNQHKLKAIQKLKDAAMRLGKIKPPEVAVASTQAAPEASAEPALAPGMESTYRLLRRMIVEMIVTREVDGLLLG
jgi:RNA polymerase sigma factor (sigma-70 family)